jgi:[acyl-carrier-protein] S-malonyltransferase
MKTAFVFPGQGSQYVGMGGEILELYPEGGAILDTAQEVTGIPVRDLMLSGPMEELTRTVNLQPVLTAVDMLCCAALRHKGVEAHAVAGHSLGEYPALWAAGFVSTADVFRLVKARGELMEQAAAANPGAMAAIIGLDRQALQDLVDRVRAEAGGGALSLANHNSREQIVVTGSKELVSELCRAVNEAGKRAVPLKVSGAYHSPLMKQAAEGFKKVLSDVEFSDGRIPLYSNVTAVPELSGERVRQLMSEQICSPVRWYEIVNNMYGDGFRLFVELGPKKVLSGLIKKCLEADDYTIKNVEDGAGLEQF